MSPFFVLAAAVAISMIVIPYAWRLAPVMGMVDEPDPRKVHARPVPRTGGWGIVLGTLLPLVLVLRFDPLVQSYVIGGLILFTYGMWDDAREAGHWVKFSGQALAAATVVYYGDLWIAHFPFAGAGGIDAAAGRAFTMFALIGMINAINHSDGLDGLAGGESLLSLMAIAFLAYIAADVTGMVIAFAAMGGILGFLRYNTHPAQVFMGDAGSQFLGFTLGFLAVYLTQIAHPALSAALPLLFLGLPVADILAVLGQRIYHRMNWFKASRNHIHHRLLDLGFHHYETVVIIYSVQAALVTCAVLLRYQADAAVAVIYAAACLGVFGSLILAERAHWCVRRGNSPSRFALAIEQARSSRLLRVGPGRLLAIFVPVYLVAGALGVATVPRDFGVVSVLLGCALLVELVVGRDPGSIRTRAAAYVAAVFVAYLLVYFASPRWAAHDGLVTAYMLVMAACAGIAIRFSNGGGFITTPTDYLIVFGIAAFAAFGTVTTDSSAAYRLMMYAIVLLYACETIFAQARTRWHALNLATLAALAVLGARGLFN